MDEQAIRVLRVATPVLTEFGPPAGEQPYGCEIELRDPDGNRLRISTAKG